MLRAGGSFVAPGVKGLHVVLSDMPANSSMCDIDEIWYRLFVLGFKLIAFFVLARAFKDGRWRCGCWLGLSWM